MRPPLRARIARRVALVALALMMLAGAVANTVMVAISDPVWLVGVIVCSWSLGQVVHLGWMLFEDGEL